MAYLRPETAQGIFTNFRQRAGESARKKPPVRHRADRQVVSKRDHAGQLPVPDSRVRADAEMEFFVPPAEWRTTSGTRSGSQAPLRVVRGRYGVDSRAVAPPRDHDARRAGALLVEACADVEYLFPFGWSRAGGHRVPHRLTTCAATAEASAASDLRLLRSAEPKDHYTPYVIEPAGRHATAWRTLAFLVDAYEEETARARRQRVVLRLAPAPGARPRSALLPLVKKEGMPERATQDPAAAAASGIPHVLRRRRVPSAGATAARTRSARRTA